MAARTASDWAAIGQGLVGTLTARHTALGLGADRFSLVLRAEGPEGPMVFQHDGAAPRYPCSLVKPFHMIHALKALEDGRLQAHSDLDRALRDMILWSSNTATNYVIDLVTGTTGDTLLYGAEYMDFAAKRGRLSGFWADLGWPEWDGSEIDQKLMDDTRYGREAQFAGEAGENLNRLTAAAAARLMADLCAGRLPLSRPLKARAEALLSRDASGPDAARPEYQLAGYLGGDLPDGALIWSKAGHNLWTGDPRTSWFKHDMIRMSGPGRRPLVAVLMTQGQTIAEGHPGLFPEIGRMIWDQTAAALTLG